jgi:hypothetical protein
MITSCADPLCLCIRAHHPRMEVIVKQRSGQPAEVLCGAVADADLLAVGSRGLSGVAGFIVGSVGLAVVALTARPAVFVRAADQASDEHARIRRGSRRRRFGRSCSASTQRAVTRPMAFAFEEGRQRDTSLHVVQSWDLPPYIACGLAADLTESAWLVDDEAVAVTEMLHPWRQKFATATVTGDCRSGETVDHLVEASGQRLPGGRGPSRPPLCDGRPAGHPRRAAPGHRRRPCRHGSS